jgi:hypothetical protein
MNFARLRLAARSACGPRARYRAARGLYFAYGSNMASARLRERAPRRARSAPRCSPTRGAATAQRRRTGRANLVADGAETWGVLYEIHDRDWEALDRAERGCERIAVSGRDGVRGAAQTYVSGSHADDGRPRRGISAAGRGRASTRCRPRGSPRRSAAPKEEAAGEQMVFRSATTASAAARTIARTQLAF